VAAAARYPKRSLLKSLLVDDSDPSCPKPYGITDGQMSLVECAAKEADEVIRSHHYSGKSTPNRFKSFRINGGLGYIQLGYGIKPAQKHTISPLIVKGNFAEFDRMWLSDELPKLSESRAIGLLLSYLKKTMPELKFIITYADESAGNIGTIYQATNAIYIGSVPVDFYRLPSGERVHPVSMWHRHKTRAMAFLQELYPGIEHIQVGRQHRYIYVLDQKICRQWTKRLPYPKLAGAVGETTPAIQSGSAGAMPAPRSTTARRALGEEEA